MSTPTLNRTECNALRGLAIIGIFLHNYCHWLGPIVKENEYQYIQRNVDWLHQVMASPDGWLPMHLLSFFGHYGVPVFLFLSAYGLVLKYESGPRLTQGAERFSITGRHLPNLGEGLRFVRYHYLKLFKMMIVGFVAFTMLDYLTPGPHHYQSLDIIAMLGMFNNVLPNPDRIIWPGPFWFFGLMLQLYIIYRLFIYRRHWAFTVVLMVVCLALYPQGKPRELPRVLSFDEFKGNANGERFLHPSAEDFHDPFLLPDMDKAVQRIHAALENGERICIFGDYDVDGICSTAMLVDYFHSVGADVGADLPE